MKPPRIGSRTVRGFQPVSKEVFPYQSIRATHVKLESGLPDTPSWKDSLETHFENVDRVLRLSFSYRGG